jgi:hypothetical protein
VLLSSFAGVRGHQGTGTVISFDNVALLPHVPREKSRT